VKGGSKKEGLRGWGSGGQKSFEKNMWIRLRIISKRPRKMVQELFGPGLKPNTDEGWRP